MKTKLMILTLVVTALGSMALVGCNPPADTTNGTTPVAKDKASTDATPPATTDTKAGDTPAPTDAAKTDIGKAGSEIKAAAADTTKAAGDAMKSGGDAMSKAGDAMKKGNSGK